MPFQVVSNKFHEGHEKEKYREEIPDDAYEKHLKCGHCSHFLLGKLQYGVKCLTCRQVYHIKCFKTEPTSCDDDDDDGEETEEILSEERIVNLTSLDDLYIGSASRAESEQILEKTSVGSFHLRYSTKKRQYVISRRLEGSADHITVDCSMMADTGYYSIRPGHGRRSLLELIQAHRVDHQLLRPVTSRP